MKAVQDWSFTNLTITILYQTAVDGEGLPMNGRPHIGNIGRAITFGWVLASHRYDNWPTSKL